MATSRMIEEERGTYTGDRIHRHNGYWAGDFFADRPATAGPTRPRTYPMVTAA
jgi:hypothetical protein